jgi:small conductance mechanosensitive channel
MATVCNAGGKPLPFDLQSLGNLLVVYGINCLGAVVIAIVGWWAAGLFERLTLRALMASAHMDATVAAFLSSLVRYSILVLTFVLILQIVGIQATSLVAVLGAASLAIGLALQGTLSNMAAGVMLLLFRPFRLGDNIEVAGKNGTVKNLNLFMTELASGDNVQVLIPNGQIWGAPITNLSAYATRSVSVKVPVPFDRSIESVTSRIHELVHRDGRVLASPPPGVTIVALTDTGTVVSVQAWTRASDADAFRAEIAQQASAAIREPVSNSGGGRTN